MFSPVYPYLPLFTCEWLSMFTHVHHCLLVNDYPCLHMFTRLYAYTLPMFAPVYSCLLHLYKLKCVQPCLVLFNSAYWPIFYPCLFVIIYVYSCLLIVSRVYLCFPLFNRKCLPMFIHVYLCSPMFTEIYSCWRMSAPVYSCLPMFTRFYLFPYLYLCSPPFSRDFLPMFGHVYSCLPTFTFMYQCLPLFTHV